MHLSRLYATLGILIALTLSGVLVAYMQRDTERITVPAWVNAAALTGVTSTSRGEERVNHATPTSVRPRYATEPGMEQWYTSTARGYSFRLPQGFSAPEIKTQTPGITGVWVHKPESDEGIAVVVYPVSVGTALSEQSIRAALKGYTLHRFTQSALGSAVRAITFYAKDPDTGRETYRLWAAYNGYVYTLEVERPYEDLLRFIAANWYFAPPFPPAPRQ